MRSDSGWTPRWQAAFRVLLGGYLAWHLASLLPWAAELFSSAGVVPRAGASPLFPLMPSVFWIADGPRVAQGVVGAGVLLALALAAGFRARLAAVLLAWVWAMLLCRNPLTLNPGLPCIGLLLVVHAMTPEPDGPGWRRPADLHAAVWVVVAAGYTYSGLWKLVSPSWLDGSALAHVLENPLARPGPLREGLLSLPPVALKLATWSALAAELLFLPLALVRRVRPWLWAAATLGHVTLLFVLDFADLTLGLLVTHAYLFEPAWLREPRTVSKNR